MQHPIFSWSASRYSSRANIFSTFERFFSINSTDQVIYLTKKLCGMTDHIISHSSTSFNLDLLITDSIGYKYLGLIYTSRYITIQEIVVKSSQNISWHGLRFQKQRIFACHEALTFFFLSQENLITMLSNSSTKQSELFISFDRKVYIYL